jgi:putative transposase
MPRRKHRNCQQYFHVINRAVRKARIFEGPDDYVAFLGVLAEAQRKLPVGLCAYCVMPNHFHLIVGPVQMTQLSAFMHWFSGTHAKRWHHFRGTSGTGPLYQGRFKAFPIQSDVHFLTVCRYVERNPLRAHLVRSAESWPWSSLFQRCNNSNVLRLETWPIPPSHNWIALVNGLDAEEEPQLDAIRRAVRFNQPFGNRDWVDHVRR